MSFDINIRTNYAREGLQNATADLKATEAAADNTKAAVAELGTAASTAGKQVAGSLDATATSASKARGDLDALNTVANKLQQETKALAGASSQQTAEWEKMLAAGKASADRQAQILERIHGPMREYESDIQALNQLLEKGKIDLADYNRELERAQSAAGRGLNPVQGPKQQPIITAGGAGSGGGPGDLLQAVAPQFGQAGSLLSQFASGGAIAAAGAAALGIEIVHLSDEYTTLANKVERFTSSGQSANEILHEQFDLSIQLRSSLAATEDLYARVHASTTELNLSTRERFELTKDIGEAVAAEGKSAEDAAALTQRLSLAFSSGTISGRELRTVMRQYPEIADGFVAALGKSRTELLQMANKGEISARQIIEAFQKMTPEVEKTLDRMPGTVSGALGHVKDRVVLAVGDMGRVISDSITGGGTSAMERIDREARAAAESARQLNTELERNAKTASIIGAARGIGIDLGPFSKEAADTVTQARMTARSVGVDIADAFANAKDKAQLYGTEIDKIKEQHSAKEIADDAKRIYEAMSGADDIVKATVRHWAELTDQVKIAREAAEKFKTSAPAGIPDAQRAQMQRELDLAAKNAQTGQDTAQYGQKMVTYAQGINTAKAALEELNRAAKDGKIGGEDLRKQYESLMTTLNDGRLPEAIKLMDEINLPVQEAVRNFAALNALLRSGRVDVIDYEIQLKKITDTHQSGEAVILAEGIATIDQRMKEGERSIRAYDAAVEKLVASFNTLHRTTSGISYRIAPQGPEADAGLLSRITQQQLYLPSVTGNADVKAALAQTQLPGLFGNASDEMKLLNEQYERAVKLSNELVAPAVKYEQTLKDIAAAVSLGKETEEEATAARRRAKDTLNQENEALEAQKGPMEAYYAALRKLQDQYEAGDISAKKYAEGVDKAKEAMLQATGAAQTFDGAMQLNWIKMQGEADKFGATMANQLVGDLDKFNEAFVTMANGGQVSWSQMADSMIQDLERIALKMLEVKAVGSLLGLLSSAGGGASSGALADTSIGLEGWQGYATGGSFIVGGDGGTDTTPVGFRATRGEQVTITPPGAYPYPQAPSAAGYAQMMRQPAPVVQIHNHYDSSVVTAGMSSPEGQTTMINMLKANRSAVRAILGVG